MISQSDADRQGFQSQFFPEGLFLSIYQLPPEDWFVLFQLFAPNRMAHKKNPFPETSFSISHRLSANYAETSKPVAASDFDGEFFQLAAGDKLIGQHFCGPCRCERPSI